MLDDLRLILQGIKQGQNWAKSSPEDAKRHISGSLTDIFLIGCAIFVLLWAFDVLNFQTLLKNVVLLGAFNFLVGLLEFQTLIRIEIATDWLLPGASILGVLSLRAYSRGISSIAGLSTGMEWVKGMRKKERD